MNQRKLLAGMVAATLALSTGAGAHAAEPQSANWFAGQVKSEVITLAEDMSFDKTDLPEGMQMAQEVSAASMEGSKLVQSVIIDAAAGTLSLDKTDLPEGVQFAQEISMGSIEGTNLVQSMAVEAVEGALAFDAGDLPEGVQFAEKGSNAVFQGAVDAE